MTQFYCQCYIIHNGVVILYVSLLVLTINNYCMIYLLSKVQVHAVVSVNESGEYK